MCSWRPTVRAVCVLHTAVCVCCTQRCVCVAHGGVCVLRCRATYCPAAPRAAEEGCWSTRGSAPPGLTDGSLGSTGGTWSPTPRHGPHSPTWRAQTHMMRNVHTHTHTHNTYTEIHQLYFIRIKPWVTHHSFLWERNSLLLRAADNNKTSLLIMLKVCWLERKKHFLDTHVCKRAPPPHKHTHTHTHTHTHAYTLLLWACLTHGDWSHWTPEPASQAPTGSTDCK